MDISWLFIAVCVWLQPSSSVAQNCTYGDLGSLTLVCSNATTSYFKNTTYKFDGLVETVRCDNCTLEILQESSFEFRGNRIVTLDLKSTGIKQIQPGAFIGLNFLEKLLLSGNAISEIQPGILKGLKKIRTLSLQNNTISAVKNDVFANATSLKKLNLHKNKIDTIEARAFVGLKNLEELDLSVNNLTKLDGVFNGLPALQNLNLSYNQINTLAVTTIKELTSLSTLTLSYNQISVIAPGQFTGKHLLSLDLSHNQIKTLSVGSFAGPVSLESLDLSHNLIREVPTRTFQRLNSLQELNMAFNYLPTFKSGVYGSGIPELRALFLSDNHISAIQVSGVFHMENLHTLDLSGNNISDLNYTTLPTHMPRLSYIDLRNNFLPCYLEDDMTTYFSEDSLDFRLFEEAEVGSRKCVDKPRPTPEPTAAPTTPSPAKEPNHDMTVHHTLQEEIELVAKEIWESEKNGTATHVAIEGGKLVVHDEDDHYNSKPAVVTIFIVLCALIVAVIFLSYSHWLTRRMVRQHAVQRALSQMQLFSSEAELDPTDGHLQL